MNAQPIQQKLEFSTPQAMFVFLQADLAVHVLNGMAAQLRLIGRPADAQSLQDFANTIATWRTEFHRADQARVVIAGPADAPH